MKIVVTGSLGHVGKPLTKELVQGGHDVTVISSKAEKQGDIEDLGAAAAIGSLDHAGFLSSAFAGADAVFAMVPPNFSEPDQIAYYRRIGSAYAQAVQQTGVKQVVHLSSYGADLDKGTGFILGSHHVENILNGLPDVAVTHLRAMYMYYNLYAFVNMIKHMGIIGANYGGNDRLIMVAPTDIAAAAAAAFSQPATGKKVRYVASDERTTREIAEVLGAAIGKPGLQWQLFSQEQARSGLERSGMSKHAMDMLLELNAAIHSGIMFNAYDNNKPEQMGTIKLEDFATAFAAAYINS